MATNRGNVQRKAEQLVRQGRLDAAIAEYQQIVEDQPTDWNSANSLGDLLVRTGQIDKAIVQYTRIADHLAREGFFPKAIALYKKVLKFNQGNDYALMRTAEISAHQGLLAVAKAHFISLLERRVARGDARGAAEVRARMGLLDPTDVDARIGGARATAEMGKPSDAAHLLAAIGLDLQGRGRSEAAFDLLREAAALAPGDEDIEGQLAAMRSALVRQLLERGEIEAARGHLASVAIGSDPERRLLAAEVDLRRGAHESARAILQGLLVDAPELGERVREMANAMAGHNLEAAFTCVDSLAGDAIAHEDWIEAAGVLTDFLARTPHHIQALVRLAEVCVDGGLIDRLHAAQAQLADAYLEAGRAGEARVIAEDLVMRTPWDRLQIERLRRALGLEGEQEPDRVIAEKVSGSSAGILDADVPALEIVGDETLGPSDSSLRDPRFELSANAIDVKAILSGELNEPTARMVQLEQVELIEVDLSAAIEELSDADEIGAGGAMDDRQKDPRDLDRVFEEFRNEVSRQDSADAAGQHVKLAVTYQEMGLIDEAIGALQAAARSPKHRFEAASMLGRLLRQRGKLGDAIEWFERAAEAPAVTADEGRALLYDLAKALEASGEIARALAVYLEIQSDASDYRDVAARIAHLSRSESEG